MCGKGKSGPAAIALRIVAFINALTSAGFIIYSFILIFPPRTAMPVYAVLYLWLDFKYYHDATGICAWRLRCCMGCA